MKLMIPFTVLGLLAHPGLGHSSRGLGHVARPRLGVSGLTSASRIRRLGDTTTRHIAMTYNLPMDAERAPTQEEISGLVFETSAFFHSNLGLGIEEAHPVYDYAVDGRSNGRVRLSFALSVPKEKEDAVDSFIEGWGSETRANLMEGYISKMEDNLLQNTTYVGLNLWVDGQRRSGCTTDVSSDDPKESVDDDNTDPEFCLLFGFFDSVAVTEPSSEDVQALVLETEHFFTATVTGEGRPDVGNVDMTNIETSLEDRSFTLSFDPLHDENKEDLFNVLEAGDYMEYIQSYVWNVEGSIFFDVQTVQFYNCTEGPPVVTEGTTTSPTTISPTVSPVPTPSPTTLSPTVSPVPTTSPTIFNSTGDATDPEFCLDYGFFDTTEITEPSSDNIESLVLETEHFFTKVVTDAGLSDLGAVALTNVETSLEEKIFTLAFDPSNEEDKEELFNVLETGDYVDYIQNHVWNLENSIFYDVQQVHFYKCSEGSPI